MSNPFMIPKMKKMGKLPSDKELNGSALQLPTSPVSPDLESPAQSPKFKRLKAMFAKNR